MNWTTRKGRKKIFSLFSLKRKFALAPLSFVLPLRHPAFVGVVRGSSSIFLQPTILHPRFSSLDDEFLATFPISRRWCLVALVCSRGGYEEMFWWSSSVGSLRTRSGQFSFFWKISLLSLFGGALGVARFDVATWWWIWNCGLEMSGLSVVDLSDVSPMR